MSISLHIKLKELERKLEALENRVLMLEMQKRPVEAVGFLAQEGRKTLTLRGNAA
jgi:hypothetical protein